jgi:hypothetical protein
MHADGQPCDNCGHKSTSLSVNVQYLSDAGKLVRANRVNPCGCLLGVAVASEGPDSRQGVPYRKRRH